ncbi:MAG: hypothetical protein IKG56_01255 [Clostridia bacterium]|nr:hypothetical protein [Clostridia bacterium]
MEESNMSNAMLILVIVVAVLLMGIVIMYMILRKRMQNSDVVRINNLRKGTEQRDFSWDVLYQKLYLKYMKIPFIKTYLFKIRRRLEINNIDDEFATRLQAAKIITKSLMIIIPLTIVVVMLTHNNYLLMSIILIFELFMIDSFSDSMVNKLDNDLLLQQADFFAQMRHSYHENNMVAEAIYSTAQDTEHIEVARQAEKIYEILNASDPEIELEKYYDVAPNNYLREFAGISYLTQEFGDRKVDNTSLYLRNLENITQEMQLEILKRDKLNYVFQSLSIISIAPIVMLEPLKSWAVSNFSFTKTFYKGNMGTIAQIVIIVATFICYILIRKLQDNGSTRMVQDNQNPWQEKVYKNKFAKKLVDSVMPKPNTKDYRRDEKLLKDAGSKQKIRWVYVNKITACIVTFIVSIVLFSIIHQIQIRFIYTEPTSTYNLLGEMSEKEERKAMETTLRQNKILDQFRGKTSTIDKDIIRAMRRSKDYQGYKDDELEQEAQQILEKLETVNSEYLKWFEVLIALAFAAFGYAAPTILIKFQIKMRQMEMEDEVMSFQTIIMMLMKIERVDVEMILEWLERYADIFKEPIGSCLNNYESGAWEALEEMKEDITYEPFIRIIESMQTSVEKVPIREAFEELDADRDYYKEKRKESNERLIDRKGRIGKTIGFVPMIITFVGYLIVPLVFIGLTSMTSSFDAMSKM